MYFRAFDQNSELNVDSTLVVIRCSDTDAMHNTILKDINHTTGQRKIGTSGCTDKKNRQKEWNRRFAENGPNADFSQQSPRMTVLSDTVQHS